jgi:hypothetical protein
LKALAYGHDVPEDKLPFVPVTKQGRVIAAMFAQNDLRPINAFVVKTRLGIKYDAGLKYHADRNNNAFHVQGTHLVLGPRQGAAA